MHLHRQEKARFLNSGPETVLIDVDGDRFLVPPGAALETGLTNDIHIAFPGDAPMIIMPISTDRPCSKV